MRRANISCAPLMCVAVVGCECGCGCGLAGLAPALALAVSDYNFNQSLVQQLVVVHVPSLLTPRIFLNAIHFVRGRLL